MVCGFYITELWTRWSGFDSLHEYVQNDPRADILFSWSVRNISFVFFLWRSGLARFISSDRCSILNPMPPYAFTMWCLGSPASLTLRSLRRIDTVYGSHLTVHCSIQKPKDYNVQNCKFTAWRGKDKILGTVSLSKKAMDIPGHKKIL
jgi:hypothetical protein